MVNKTIPVIAKAQSTKQDYTKSIEESIAKFKKELATGIRLALVSSSVLEALSSRAIAILNNMQAEYWGGASGEILKEDPTQFGLPEQHSKVRTEIYKNLQLAASSVSDDGTIEITPLSDGFMGIGGGSNSAEGIPWMAYFLSGALDTDLVWISADTYSKLKGDSGSGAANLGRFGVGHMWHVPKEQAKSFTAWLHSSGLTDLSYDTLKHPQSGKAGMDWFSDLVPSSGIVELIHKFALEYANNKVR